MGKGTLFVPAAHGAVGKNAADPEGVEGLGVRRPRGQQNLPPGETAPVRPLQGRKIKGSPTVGGGHKKRALAHGY